VLAQALGIRSGDIDGLAIGIDARMVHGRRDGSRRGDETLDLLRPPSPAIEPLGQLTHIIISASREGTHQVWDEILLLAGALGCAFKHRREIEKVGKRRLPHQTQHS